MERRHPTPEPVEVGVIGAGVNGLAVGQVLARDGQDVVVFEARERIGLHTSSRNSQVIHAGIPYPEGSLKARLCVRGKTLLYDYLEENKIPHRRIGKLIVATQEKEVDELIKLRSRAEKNGVDDLEWLSAKEIRELEPAVVALAALYSPSTGIFDSHQFMESLHRDILKAGGDVSLNTPFLEGEVTEGGIILSLGGGEPAKVICQAVINATGLWASEVAGKIKGLEKNFIPETAYFKGHYFRLKGASVFNHLIYPLPKEGGLGIHVTLDLAGSVLFGPDSVPVGTVDYGFEEGREEIFYREIRRYYPALPDGALERDQVGIRPRVLPKKGEEADFIIQGEAVHGIPRLVNNFGVESPGLTAALAIAEADKEELQSR